MNGAASTRWCLQSPWTCAEYPVTSRPRTMWVRPDRKLLLIGTPVTGFSHGSQVRIRIVFPLPPPLFKLAISETILNLCCHNEWEHVKACLHRETGASFNDMTKESESLALALGTIHSSPRNTGPRIKARGNAVSWVAHYFCALHKSVAKFKTNWNCSQLSPVLIHFTVSLGVVLFHSLGVIVPATLLIWKLQTQIHTSIAFLSRWSVCLGCIK